MRSLCKVLICIALLGCLTPTASFAADPAARTGKERLSDKASDEQRVNDCKVPPERRGRSTRPPDCTADLGS